MKSKNARQEIALERIWRLFELAEQEFESCPERSKRYIELARRIGSRNKATIPAELKKRYCKKCGAFLVKGKNAEMREEEKWVEITCRECGFRFKKRKSLKVG
ncbi:MAG: ribonuclease P [Candidatus Diapherotrites archaeon]|nr:ribonuclease P [Candidatus Diapherotrites archaeon]